MNLWDASNLRFGKRLGTLLKSVFWAAVFIYGPIVSGDTFVVTNTSDSGAGSLREAINQANDNTGPDTIEFDIPGVGPHTIQPAAGLPEITDAVIIDGFTQSGASPNSNPQGFGKNSVLMIELDGSDAGAASGLVLIAPNCTVRGLVINRFQGAAGIFINGSEASGNVVQGNFIGTDVSGNADLGNARFGVLIQAAPDNTVGGSQARQGNVISGNDQFGIAIVVAGASGNVVQGNYIGTDATGSADLGNAVAGVDIQDAPDNTIGGSQPGEGNVISGNHLDGVLMDAGASGNVVQGNFIGTDATGSADLGNTLSGVSIISAPNNTVGGAQAGEGNVISGNDRAGIYILLRKASGNVVRGNFIGTNVTGSSALGNARSGVLISDVPNNTVGGAQAGEGNVISGNDWAGINIFGTRARGNVVQGNFIGTNVTGSADLGNASAGVLIQDAPDNTIGGSQPGAGNVIVFNDFNGVLMGVSLEDTNVSNSVRGSAIYGNGALGIDLGSDGVSVNDNLDADTGPNNLQNFPVITSALATEGSTQIVGNLKSLPNEEFMLDFYASSQVDASGFGEGERYLGASTVMTDDFGDSSFDITLAGEIIDGEFFTATATDSFGNTGEFSQAVPFRDTEAIGSFLEEFSKRTADDGASDDRFGLSLAVGGDTFVVGAFGDDGARGSAYIFDRHADTSDNWKQVAKLTAGDDNPESQFGVSVALDGDTVVIGANFDFGLGLVSGAAYIFEREASTSNWEQVARLTADDGDAGDRFGFSVAIGEDTLAVGAPGDDDFQGAGYIFERDASASGNWEQVAKLTATDGEPNDQFGVSVALGEDTLVVGALGDGDFQGAAYVFERDVGASRKWGQVAKLTAAYGAPNDQFGFSVAVNRNTIVSGAPGDDFLQGSANVFERNRNEAGNWREVARLAAGAGILFDQFGVSVAVDGDTIVAVALGDALFRGSAYIFERNAGGSDN